MVQLMVSHPPMNPVAQIIKDRQTARNQGDTNADICFLALSGDEGPSVRTLVLRDIENRNFNLFINKTSPKWHLAEQYPQAQLLLWYSSLQRQYRVSGRLEELDRKVVEVNWQRRPVDSKYFDQVYDHLGAQSSVIDRRDTLIQCIDSLKKELPEDSLTMPSSLTGLALQADRIEYLDLGMRDRIQDRRIYTLEKPLNNDETWVEQILIP